MDPQWLSDPSSQAVFIRWRLQRPFHSIWLLQVNTARLWLSAASAGVAAFILAKRNLGLGFWTAITAPYIIIAPCIALLWLRSNAQEGEALSYLLFGRCLGRGYGCVYFRQAHWRAQNQSCIVPIQNLGGHWRRRCWGCLGWRDCGKSVVCRRKPIVFWPLAAVFWGGSRCSATL